MPSKKSKPDYKIELRCSYCRSRWKDWMPDDYQLVSCATCGGTNRYVIPPNESRGMLTQHEQPDTLRLIWTLIDRIESLESEVSLLGPNHDDP